MENFFRQNGPEMQSGLPTRNEVVRAMIGLGANLGDAQNTLCEAIESIAATEMIALHAKSGFYASAPVDADGDDYVNAVIAIDTTLDALELLHALQKIEAQFGRQRSYRNAPRTLDLDLLLYGQQQISSTELTVPHPRITERAFVLLPLLQLDPKSVIPGLGACVQYIDKVQDQRIHLI